MAGLNGLGGKKGERGDEGARGKEGKEGEAGNTFLPWVIKDNPKIKCNECVFMSVDDGWGVLSICCSWFWSKGPEFKLYAERSIFQIFSLAYAKCIFSDFKEHWKHDVHA